MKTLLALLLLLASPLHAINLTFEWDAPSEDFQNESYNIYEVTSASEVVKLGNSTTPEFTVQNATPGVHWYYVTLVNMWGESTPYADGKTPPVFPETLPKGKLRFKIVNLQGSTDMIKWDDIASVAVPEAPGGRTFYTLAFAP